MWSLGVVLYNVISGDSPFFEDRLYDQILNGEFNLIDDTWNVVSAEVEDLVCQLMYVNPKNRLTSQRTLGHEWLGEDVIECAPWGATLRTLPVKRKRKKAEGTHHSREHVSAQSGEFREEAPAGRRRCNIH